MRADLFRKRPSSLTMAVQLVRKIFTEMVRFVVAFPAGILVAARAVMSHRRVEYARLLRYFSVCILYTLVDTHMCSAHDRNSQKKSYKREGTIHGGSKIS